MIKTHGLNHISLSVEDPDRSLAFYAELFGVREYYRDENSIQVLGPGPHDVIAFERSSSPNQPGGIDHFGFRLTSPADAADAARKAEAAGAWPGQWEQGTKDRATAGLFLYVEDCDALYQQAVDAGCEAIVPMEDQFWGDRMGKVKDPFGHCWAIATHQWIYTPEEMQKGQQEWLASQTPGP